MKCKPTEAAKKCEIQRSHRLTPPSNDGLVTKKTQKHGVLVARPRFLLLESHIVGKGRTVEEICLVVLNCPEVKSSSEKFQGTMARIMLHVVCGRLNSPQPSWTTPLAGTHYR